MSIKQQEFLALKQRQKSVTEYLHEFNFLARYAPDDVSTDLRRRNRFMNGLTEELQMALLVQDFRNFQHLVSKAIIAESKSKALDEARKRKRAAQMVSSSSSPRPRMWRPQPLRAIVPAFPRLPVFAPRPPPSTGQPRAVMNQPQTANNVKPGVICCHCGRPEHFANQCYVKARSLPPVRPTPTPV